ncbi:DUF3817 domain-containing protein [Gephyromycinifex aptenodytis]|uniref:DUF3817 domain-containing protein n=1 Tax=Gephyromycinifex aptenodytis TaxID=2716227 RepID=UPI0014488210|nr:DUF3817 domain-containing protein [Gephyromycinifex aptenodytis]
MTPATVFKRLAFAEAVTWTLLIIGMVLKYVTHTTDLGVQVFGLVHGVVFLSYVIATVAIWIDQQWRVSTGVLGLFSSVIPYATVWFERLVESRGLLSGAWRVTGDVEQLTGAEKVLSRALARPVLACVLAVLLVAALTAFLLYLGPPTSWGRA